jgi:hypothetical protein
MSCDWHRSRRGRAPAFGGVHTPPAPDVAPECRGRVRRVGDALSRVPLRLRGHAMLLGAAGPPVSCASAHADEPVARPLTSPITTAAQSSAPLRETLAGPFSWVCNSSYSAVWRGMSLSHPSHEIASLTRSGRFAIVRLRKGFLSKLAAQEWPRGWLVERGTRQTS